MSRRTLIALLLTLVAGVAATAFVLGHGHTLFELASHIGSIDPATAGLGVVASALAISNRGYLNRSAHRAVGLETDAAEMTHTAAVGFAAQKLVKSAGAIGLAVFVRHGRRRGHAPGAVAAACALSAAASFAALGVLLAAAVVVLAVTGELTGWWAAAAVGFAIYTAVVIAVAAVLVRSRPAAERLWRGAQRLRGRVRRRRGVETVITPLPTGLFEAIDHVRRRPVATVRLLVHAVLSKALGAVMLALAADAVGVAIGPADALVIYATALAASFVSIAPGGVGTVEGSTVALLVAAGASAGFAALAVALFRVFDLWLPVLTGAVAARGELRPAATPDADVDADIDLIALPAPRLVAA